MEEKQNKPRKDFKSKGKFGGKKFGEKKFGGKKFGEKKFGGRGKSFGKDKPDFKKRKLAPGVEFVDRELGVGIVRKLTDEGIVVAFGDAEKLIPRKKREGGYKKTASRRMDIVRISKGSLQRSEADGKEGIHLRCTSAGCKADRFQKREAAVGPRSRMRRSVRARSPASQSAARMSLMMRQASASSIRWDFRRSF